MIGKKSKSATNACRPGSVADKRCMIEATRLMEPGIVSQFIIAIRRVEHVVKAPVWG